MTLPILRRGGSAVRRGEGQTQWPQINRVDPWNDFEVMNRLFNSFLQSPLSGFGRSLGSGISASETPVELYETSDDLLAFVYAPGLAPDSFDISASGDAITVKAERKLLLEVTEGLISHTPWTGHTTSASTFTASYQLPVEIDPARVEAHYKDGVLHVRMPKSEAAKPKQVKVAVSNE